MAFYSEPGRSTIFQSAGDPAAGWRGGRWHWPWPRSTWRWRSRSGAGPGGRRPP